MDDIILEMKDITKIFPGVKALDSVNICVHKGKIHAVCGENGAGKSTLINVLSGVHPYGTYEGNILINGKEFYFSNTSEAEQQGIVCIHQELELIPELNVAENIFIGKFPKKNGLIQWNEVYYETEKLLQKVGLAKTEGRETQVKPDDKVKNLGIGQQQLVEIAKALSRDAKILILDEPTAALTENEVDNLLGILNNLREKGITCIYISHKLDEVMRIADYVTILRDGKAVGSSSVSEITKNEIIRLMVGRELNNLFPYEDHKRSDPVLEIIDYSVWNPNIPNRKLIKNINLKIYKGEILGISGLMGAGRTELFSSVYGAFKAKSEGTVKIEGNQIRIKSPAHALKNGIALIPEDRKRHGLVLLMDVKENTTLAALKEISKMGIINENLEIYKTTNLIDKLKTKTSGVNQKVKYLSGGNQQKVVLQKALLTKPKVLILDEPTRGIDVGAKYEIYKIMNQLVDEGVAIVMIASELEEILGMSNRIAVMSEGALTAEFESGEATQEKIMLAAVGGKI